MNIALLWLLYRGLLGSLLYHPTSDVKLVINITFESKSFYIQNMDLLSETILHEDIELCIENQLEPNPNVSVQVWDHELNEFSKPVLIQNKFTVLEKNLTHNWIPAIRDGLKIIINAIGSSARGVIYFKRCRRNILTTLDNVTSFEPIPFRGWQSTIHLPFFILPTKRVTKYVDFSTIMPRRAGHDWSKKAFCMNSTLNGNVKVHMSRCESLSRNPFTIELQPNGNRQIVQYWNEFTVLENRCPITKESLPDHVWIEIESIDHNELGEIIIYNCHHTWVLEENNEEVIKITPTLDKTESNHKTFDYVLQPFHRNVYFAPVKHMIDVALITGADIQLSLSNIQPQTVTFSSCYASSRYVFINSSDKIRMNLTIDELMILSDFSNDFACPEEKSSHGFYIGIDADDLQIIGSVTIKLMNHKGVQTPEGILKNDEFTTVPFNLQKGDWISRNVDIHNFINQAASNSHVELYQMFNATGLVNLYISRCEFSPKLKLFGPMRLGSIVFESLTINYIMQLYEISDCLSDFQMERYEYKSADNFGLYIHVEALENTIGYVAVYETIRAMLIFHEIHDDFSPSPRDMRVDQSFRVFKKTDEKTEVQISHLINRVRGTSDVSLRFYIDSTGPLAFAFTKCSEDIISNWKILPMRQIDNYSAWYTFDSEGLDLLQAYSESRDCFNKPHSELYIHVKAESLIFVSFEFSIANSTKLGNTCKNSEKLNVDGQNKFFALLLTIALIVAVILGGFISVLIYINLESSKNANIANVELLPMS